eukprot:5129749-Amphidinium_carterae.2
MHGAQCAKWELSPPVVLYHSKRHQPCFMHLFRKPHRGGQDSECTDNYKRKTVYVSNLARMNN